MRLWEWMLTGLGSVDLKGAAGNCCVFAGLLIGCARPAERKGYFGFVNGGQVG